MATQPPAEMRRWQIPSPGTFTQSLTLATVPTPSSPLAPSQLLVRVAAAGINPAEYKFPDLGLVAKAMLPFPKSPGMDFSGHVLAVGSSVTDIQPGDVVLGRLDPLGAQGSLSEYIVAERAGVAALSSAKIDLADAAGVGTAALTAYQTIAPYVVTGDRVFINGGSGGTGTFGVQIAKALGCHVTVSCSTAKKALCKDLGADDIIDYKTADVVAALREQGKVFALVVDNVGNAPPNLYKASDDFLLPEGRFKFVGGAVSVAQVRSLLPSMFLPGFLGGAKHRFEAFITKNSAEDLAQIVAWMEEGKVRTVVDTSFKFEEAREAYLKLKEGSTAGKIVVRVEEKA
ncbi:Zinc-type alcohol dehydrogenase-like protein [Colletotrichum trifolii]|uniref:Zinc-type alcohol dehydrogenase-like protein n=1 Tax=Colletotrichum trifolii TaxID=5466 RepID=A0A4V3HWX0_COLTR|nr:Zinc-type alcohol dehydrogenase-like protein [Colletotrichum trifolii]